MTDTTSHIVVNCPVCRRVIWSGAYCSHGSVPPPKYSSTIIDKPAKKSSKLKDGKY